MRIFTFLVCGICGSIVADESHGNNDRRGFKNKFPNANETISTASEVFKLLINTELKSFAKTLLTIKTDKLISALKSVSIAAGITSGFFEPLDSKTASDIFNNVDALMERTATFQAPQNLKNRYRDDYLDRTRAAYQAVKEYRSDRYSFDEEQFQLAYNNSRVGYTYPFNELWVTFFLKDVAVQSKYDKEKIAEAREAIALTLVQAYIVQYFWAGIPFDGDSYETKVNELNHDFELIIRQLPDAFEKIDTFYRESYFPGFVNESFIFPAVDCVKSGRSGCNSPNNYTSENCNIANHIITQIREKFPERHYAAIVSDYARIKKDFLFINRTQIVFEENYSGKTVMVFMISKNFTEKYDKYREENVRQRILNQELDRGNHLDTLLDYAKYGKRDVQMAVFNDRVAPCFVTSKSNAADYFPWEKNGLKAKVHIIF